MSEEIKDIVDVSPLDSKIDGLVKTIMDEEDPNKTKDLVDMFNWNISKKNVARLQKLNNLNNSFNFVLDEYGKEFTSIELSEKISKIATEGNSTITFVIGGSLGLSKQVKESANVLLSFSKLTFPHQMIRIFLLEQIFRAFKINNNETYHH